MAEEKQTFCCAKITIMFSFFCVFFYSDYYNRNLEVIIKGIMDSKF